MPLKFVLIFQLCQGVLNEIQSRDIPSRNIVALTIRIALELDKFSTSHLVSIAEQCVEFIRNSNSSTQTWLVNNKIFVNSRINVRFLSLDFHNFSHNFLLFFYFET